MNIEPKHIITGVLVIFKIYIIVNFIVKYRKMIKRISILEEENKELKSTNSSSLKESA